MFGINIITQAGATGADFRITKVGATVFNFLTGSNDPYPYVPCPGCMTVEFAGIIAIGNDFGSVIITPVTEPNVYNNYWLTDMTWGTVPEPNTVLLVGSVLTVCAFLKRRLQATD